MSFRDAALRQLEELVARFGGAQPLNRAALARHAPLQFTGGWAIPLLSSDNHTLHLLVPQGFPYEPLRVAVCPPPPNGWPNVEATGLVCLNYDESRVDPHQVAQGACEQLEEARQLIEARLAGDVDDLYDNEFIAYWNRAIDERFARVLSLVTPAPPIRAVHVAFLDRVTLVAETAEDIRRWYEQRFNGAKCPATIVSAPLLWLPRPPRPSEFPRSVRDIRVLAEMAGGQTLLDSLLAKKPDKLLCMLGAESPTGPGLIAVRFDRPQRPHARAADPLTKGFTKAPDSVLVARYLSVAVRRLTVERIDGSWVHGRGHDPDQPTLAGKSIVLIGGGSLGSGVMRLLAQAGVGKLVVIDPQSMAPENASRHELGIRDADRGKAKGLQADLGARFPHLRIEGRATHWETVWNEEPDVFLGADLVVATIGNWGAEGYLNQVHAEHVGFPPIIYGWAEPHATAGHAVLVGRAAGCFACGLDNHGGVKAPVTRWPGATEVRFPACGGVFQPYGAVAMSHIQAVVADLALAALRGDAGEGAHHVWIGRKAALERAGGEWNPAWIVAHGDPGQGGCELVLTWDWDPTCFVCSGVEQ